MAARIAKAAEEFDAGLADDLITARALAASRSTWCAKRISEEMRCERRASWVGVVVGGRAEAEEIGRQEEGRAQKLVCGTHDENSSDCRRSRNASTGHRLRSEAS